MIRRRLAAIAAAMLVLYAGMTGYAEEADKMQLKKIFDGVYDAGVYTEVDEAFIQQYDAKHHDGWGGLCTAAAKVLPDGTTIVGRNLDMLITHIPAYVFRTKVPGCYETITLSYDTSSGCTEAQVLQHGLPQDYARALPGFSPDILNSAGLFIEMNMRSMEADAQGMDIFGTSGTNPAADLRVSELALTRFIAEHCATIEEALAYVHTLDIYSMNSGDYQWALSYLMADATGRCGVLEIAQNRIVWLEGQAVQTNFYLHPDFAAQQQLKIGLGRYDAAMAALPGVASKEDMLALMKQLSYLHSYSDACSYDPRTELVGHAPAWTTAYVLDEANCEEIQSALDERGQRARGKSFTTLQDEACCLASILTEVVDCTNRTITVRFFEDDERTITLSFDE